MHVIKYLLDMSSIESCGEQSRWSQVHHANSSERQDPSRAENPSEQTLTVAALLIHISAGGCLANGCTYIHNWTHARWQARTSVLTQGNISTQHHTHNEKESTPLHSNFLACAKRLLCANLASHLLSFFSFTYLLAFLLPFDVFQRQMNAMQKLCYCNVYPARSGRWQKLSGIQRWGRSANKSSHARHFQKHSQRQGQGDQNS